MAKVVYNKGFGGFGLSIKAIERFFEIKGQKIFTYYQVSHFEKVDLLVKDASKALEKELKKGYFRRCTFFSDVDLGEEVQLTANTLKHQIADYEWEEKLKRDRTNPTLVRVVEELGEEANSRTSCLNIIEIPDGTEYTITEYDGSEAVLTKEELVNSYIWKKA